MEETKNQNKISKIHIWFVAGIVFLLIVSILLFLLAKTAGDRKNEQGNSNSIQSTSSQESKILSPRLLDGVMVVQGEENNYPVAVIIDNFPAARPQYGLAMANIVYEAEAEGGVTRYLAVFSDYKDIKKIGPVRSARPYYVAWAEEYGALFAHCGGSPDALSKILADDVLDLNEFYNGSYFWRDSRHSAPHNIFTSGELLTSYLVKEQKQKSNFSPWLFKTEEDKSNRASTSEVAIRYNINYKIKWVYKNNENVYQRYINNDEVKDADGRSVLAKNIIIQYIQSEVLDEKLRLKIKTTGKGKAVVCMDGKCAVGEWQQKSESGRTRFYDEIGKEIKFNPGQTWVQVVESGSEVKY